MAGMKWIAERRYPMHQQDQPFQTRNFFYLLLLAVIYLAYVLIKPYLGVILFSLVAVVVFRPAYEALFTFDTRSSRDGARCRHFC